MSRPTVDTINVDIYGTREPSRGRSCECHFCCGIEVLDPGVVVEFKKVLIQREPDAPEETAIAVYWVSNTKPLC
jgi:hypothetical protein